MKNIVIIGGSHGIGLETVKILSQDHQIHLFSRTAPEVSLPHVNHSVFDVLTDAFPIDQINTPIDGFVYCPGSINLKPLKMLSNEAFRADMEINFFAMLPIIQAIMPKMNEGSSMVFYSTVAVAMGMPFHASIAAAKGAVEGFVKSIAAENAPKLRVNCIAPSLTNTPLAGRFIKQR
jgi:NAD(P)-dependent dehydrogenase (short-subunit alcohol dehydrogenase family)